MLGTRQWAVPDEDASDISGFVSYLLEREGITLDLRVVKRLKQSLAAPLKIYFALRRTF